MGLDVSDNVGQVDWTALPGQGFVFAYIKASGGFSNRSPGYRDQEFANNWPNAQAAGIRRGAYHLSLIHI